jgi:hypothetical protein
MIKARQTLKNLQASRIRAQAYGGGLQYGSGVGSMEGSTVYGYSGNSGPPIDYSQYTNANNMGYNPSNQPFSYGGGGSGGYGGAPAPAPDSEPVEEAEPEIEEVIVEAEPVEETFVPAAGYGTQVGGPNGTPVIELGGTFTGGTTSNSENKEEEQPEENEEDMPRDEEIKAVGNGRGYGGGNPPSGGGNQTGGGSNQSGSGAPTKIVQTTPEYTIPEMEAVKARAYGMDTAKKDIQSVGYASTVKIEEDVAAPDMGETAEQAAPDKIGPAAKVEGAKFDASLIGTGADVTAAQGQLSPEAIARAEDAELSERAVAAQRDTQAEREAQAGNVVFDVNSGAYVNKVSGKTASVEEAKAAEAQTRKAITDDTLSEGEVAKIIGTVGFEAAQRRTVQGEAAKGAAAGMLAEVGELPPEITAAIVEDPATVEAAIDEQPVEVRAAVAALPTEALVSSQMESLLGGLEDGKTPAWAKPALAAVEANLARRGMNASSVGRDAMFNAIIQSAMPMAQSNAQALQQRASQNLSNEQQANMSTATLDMQRRMANLSNQQTASSQTAQMAQQMATMQSQFRQDAVMTTAQMQQQTRTQNLSNLQEAAKVTAMNEQAMRAQNLGNEQQIELAEMQYMNATESENMSAVQQERLAEMQTAADFLSKNAGFKQQMELANLSNDQQMKLANLTALNQSESENLSAAQQTELANLNNRMQTNMLQGKIAAEMNQAQLTVDQQRAVQNASMVANIDLTKFNAAQQVELTNSKFMQTMVSAQFSAEQQAAIQNATALASLDMANLDKNTRLAAQNAQSFLQMDMSNLNNEQQANVIRSQNQQQAMLSDQAATNASRQFAATSQQQADQFMSSLGVQVEQYNSSAAAARDQFNATEKNRMAAIDAGNELQAQQFNNQLAVDVQKFNEQSDFQRDQWNAANAQAVEQSNIQWRRQANLADTAAQNAANQQNVQIAYNMTSQEQTQLWQQLRDEAAYIRQNYENEQQRKAQMIATAIGNESVFTKAGDANSFISTIINSISRTG